MAPMPVPPGSGGDDRVSELLQGLQLSDAEGIAAARLDGAAEGSLKEALAVASADDADDASPRPAEHIDTASECFASGPLVRLIDAHTLGMGRARAGEPLDTFSPMPMPPVLDIGVAVVAPADSTPPPALAAIEAEEGGEPVLTASEDWQGFSGDAPLPAPLMPLQVEAAQSTQPLASALDAAVRLAADANVAAEALQNLKRLLEHKQRLESQLLQRAVDPAPAPAWENAEEPAPMPGALAPQPLLPLPLPLHAEPDSDGRPAGAMLPPAPRQRPPPERRGLDVLGFMAGFALSWAFGVVLYFFMTAG